MVKAHIKNSDFFEQTNLGRQATCEIIIHKDDLIKSITHIANASRNATTKVVIGKNKNRNRRVAKIRRDTKLESIVI